MNTKCLPALWLAMLASCLTSFAQTSVPTVTTLAAGVTSTNATLNGTVNPNGAATAAYFRFGLTTNYDNIGAATILPAANTTLAVPGLAVNSLRGAAGANWTQSSAPAYSWNSLAASSDGMRLAATVNGGNIDAGIYTSTNGGATWTLTGAPSLLWSSIASSADGLRLAACAYEDDIYTSTNGGVTWTSTYGASYWISITSSADGTRLVALNTIFVAAVVSTNGGANWTRYNTPDLDSSIASSSDGMRLAAAGDNPTYGNAIDISTDGGMSWTQTSAPNESWASITSSSDGTRLAAVALDDGIYTSTNGGATWTQTSAPNCTSVVSSYDGQRLAAGSENGAVYTSTNGGVTWSQAALPDAAWASVAINGVGTRMVAADINDTNGIFTSTGPASPILPGTTYHCQLVGVSSLGQVSGSDAMFTTTVGLPTATTLAANGISRTNAALNGTVNTGGFNTQAYFQYGLTTSYGSYTPTNNLGATNTTLPLASLTGGLSPDTVYHYRLATLNSAGANAGSDLTFTTIANPPSVTTLAATALTTTNATLNGAVNSGGPNVAAYFYFQYGPTTNYGNYTPTNNLGATNVTLPVASSIGSLLPGTVYHYQLVGLDYAGASVGSDVTFSTTVGLPTATTLAANPLSHTNATLNGTINTGGLNTKAYFQYGSTASYGSYTATNNLGATNTTLPLASLIGGLSSGTAYHFRLVGLNSTGTNAGNDLTFTTAFDPPGVTTLAATAVTTSSATLNGTVYPDNAQTLAYFRYGLTTNYSNLGDVQILPATSATLDMPGLIVNSIGTAGGAYWAPSGASPARNTYWSGIASSVDGMRLVATDYGGSISTSTNGGVDWMSSDAPVANWFSIASSADGTRLAATSNTGIYTSTNGGLNWTLSVPPGDHYPTSIASSSDGMQLNAAYHGGYIYASTNGGSSWIFSSAPDASWTAITSSFDGVRLAACSAGGDIYTSTNGGATWAATGVGGLNWSSIASSADGTHLAAVESGGGIWLSMDGGVTWTLSSAPGAGWRSIASSFDGQYLAAAINGGPVYEAGVYFSTDAGADWTPGGVSDGDGDWYGICCSGDGTRLAMAGLSSFGTSIYTSVGSVSTLLPGAAYHYQLEGISFAGSGLGSDLTFTIPPLAPTVTALAANGVTPTGATLNGTVNPNGAATSAYFQYGLTTNYGSFSAITNLAASNGIVGIPTPIGGLVPDTMYHFRLAASNSVATAYGADLTFTTTQEFFTEGDSLSARTYDTDTDPTNAQFVVDFPITAPGSLERILTWGQNSGTGIPGVGQTFYAYVLRPIGGNFQVMLGTGPLTVTSVGTNSFAAPPFNVQTGDLIAHYGRGIPLSIGTGGPSTIYSNLGLPIPMPSVGQILTLPSATYPLYNDGGRNYAIAVVLDGVPNLAITQAGHNFTLSWPAIYPNTLLQTTNLASGVWTTNTTFTTTVGTNSVTIPVSAGNLFFRLRSP